MSDSIKAAWEERNKLHAEGDKCYVKAYRRRAKSDKFWFEIRKLSAEGDKLRAEGDRLYAEGDLIFIEAVIAVHGPTAEITYTEDGYKIDAVIAVRGPTTKIVYTKDATKSDNLHW